MDLPAARSQVFTHLASQSPLTLIELAQAILDGIYTACKDQEAVILRDPLIGLLGNPQTTAAVDITLPAEYVLMDVEPAIHVGFDSFESSLTVSVINGIDCSLSLLTRTLGDEPTFTEFTFSGEDNSSSLSDLVNQALSALDA